MKHRNKGYLLLMRHKCPKDRKVTENILRMWTLNGGYYIPNLAQLDCKFPC